MATSAAFMLTALVYTIFVMREKKQEKKISARDVLNFHSFSEGIAVVFCKRERGAKTVIITIIIICILCQFSWGTRFSVHPTPRIPYVHPLVLCNRFWLFNQNPSCIFGRFMGIDYYYLRATYPWPEQSYDPTYPVRWVSQFYTISDVSQVQLPVSSIWGDFSAQNFS